MTLRPVFFIGICLFYLSSIQSTTYVPLFNAGNGMYTMQVAMGTPGQTLMLMLDGWTADVWVPTIASLGPANRTHSTFNSRTSNTYKDLNKQQILGFPHTGGNIVQVAIGTDVFGITKENTILKDSLTSSLNNLPVYLGVANKEDPWFIFAPWDGMIGLALGVAQIDTTSIITRITNEANIPALFGIYYTNGYGYNGSELTIGGYNTNYFYNPSSLPIYTPLLPAGTGGNSNNNPSPSDNPLYDVWRFRLPYITIVYSTDNDEDYTSANEAANILSVGWTNAHTNSLDKTEKTVSSTASASLTGPYSSLSDGTTDIVLPSYTEMNDNGLNICADNIFCAGTIELTGGTLGLPIPQLTSLIAAINATVNGQCIIDHASIQPVHTARSGRDPTIGNIPYQPKYVFCPNASLSTDTMPILTFTISTSYGSDGTDTTNDLYDIPIVPTAYCVSSWMDTFVNEQGTTIPINHYSPHGMCRLLLSGVASSLASDSYDFLLGSPFIQSYYTILDADNNRVGITGIRNDGPFPSMYTQTSNNFWGSREMWAIVIAVIVCTIIGVGIYVVVRDRIREKHSQQVRDFFRTTDDNDGGNPSRSSSIFSINNHSTAHDPHNINVNDDEEEENNYRQRMLQDELYSHENDWNVHYNEDYVPNHYTTNNPNNNTTNGVLSSKFTTTSSSSVFSSKPSSILHSALYSLRGNGSPSTSFRGIRGSLNTSFYTTGSNDYINHHNARRDSFIDGTVIMNDPSSRQPYYYNRNNNSNNNHNISPSAPSSPYYSLRDGAVLRTSLGDLQGSGAHAFYDGQ